MRALSSWDDSFSAGVSVVAAGAALLFAGSAATERFSGVFGGGIDALLWISGSSNTDWIVMAGGSERSFTGPT